MEAAITQTTAEFELAMFSLAREDHGFYERVAPEIGSRPTVIRQSINPNYLERRSFITKAAGFFIAWIVLHPATGMQALWLFVMFVLQHAPVDLLQKQILVIEDYVTEVKDKFGAAQAVIDAMPEVRLECREHVKRRRAKRK